MLCIYIVCMCKLLSSFSRYVNKALYYYIVIFHLHYIFAYTIYTLYLVEEILYMDIMCIVTS